MYVYWWHVSGLRAVKVGHADHPIRLVSDYRSAHGLSGKDVRGYELDGGIDAAWVESQLRRLLETKGLRRIALRLGEEDEEFFALGAVTFEEAHELLSDAARHIALAEVSNQRKQQRRNELQVAPAPMPDEPVQETTQVHEEPEPDPPPQHAAAPAPAPPPAAVRPWLYLAGAIVASGMAAVLGSDALAPDRESASRAAQNAPSVATVLQEGDAPAGPLPANPCMLVEFSDTLIHVTCDGSWASMRWNGRWTFDSGHNERDALDFFQASDAARKVVALPAREPVPQLPEKTEVKPERLPPPNQAVAPAAPPPQPHPRPAPPRAVTVQPPPPQEAPPPVQRCTVSRPKPGFQVYLVTCPTSQVTIGRTIDSTDGWAVSDSVNGTEAIEFFMKSPYAR